MLRYLALFMWENISFFHITQLNFIGHLITMYTKIYGTKAICYQMLLVSG